jgi:hypothetical protein
MSSTVLSRALVCASLALVSSAALAKESQPVLSCETAKVERAALGQAPKGARRVETHVLENRGRSDLWTNRRMMRAIWAAYTGATAASMPKPRLI